MAASTLARQCGVALFSALLAGAAFIGACSSNDANPQPPPVYTTGGDSGTPQSGGDSGSVVTPGNDASTADDAAHDSAPTPPVDAAGCTADSGCWSCTPASTPEFLNQCTSSQCSPFANATRLPNYDGGLPPLQ